MLNDPKLFQAFLKITVTCAIVVGALALGVGTASGYISPWTGRFYSLLDPTYAKDHIPIIASVSEHQPTAWSSFMFDFHILLYLFPAGLYFCFKRLSDATIFIVMYGLTSMYFAGVMVRLILVATPAMCLISAIAVSATIKNLTQLLRGKSKVAPASSGKGSSSTKASSKVRSLITITVYCRFLIWIPFLELCNDCTGFSGACLHFTYGLFLISPLLPIAL